MQKLQSTFWIRAFTTVAAKDNAKDGIAEKPVAQRKKSC
jgi:hypothetical protein